MTFEPGNAKRDFRFWRLAACLLTLTAPPALAQDTSSPSTTEPIAIIEEDVAQALDADLNTGLPTPLTRTDFEPCPVEELRASWQVLLPAGEAQTGLAIEEEVLRFCRERQATINEIIEEAQELPTLLGNLRTANTARSQPVPEPAPAVDPAPVPTSTPSVDPVSSPASPVRKVATATDRTLQAINTAASSAPGPAPGIPAQEIWDHQVRFIVRAGDEAWRARIVSIRTPPPTVTTDNTGNRITLPSSPDPARVSTVTAGDELPDGSTVAAIDVKGVLIRDATASAQDPRRLLSEPVPEPETREATGFIVRRISE